MRLVCLFLRVACGLLTKTIHSTTHSFLIIPLLLHSLAHRFELSLQKLSPTTRKDATKRRLP